MLQWDYDHKTKGAFHVQATLPAAVRDRSRCGFGCRFTHGRMLDGFICHFLY